MQLQRWLRMMPGRRQWLLLGVVAFLIFVAVNFVQLALVKNAAVVRNERAQAVLIQQQEQQSLLLQELSLAQQGQHVPQRAWDFFGKLGEKMGIILAQPRSGEATPAP